MVKDMPCILSCNVLCVLSSYSENRVEGLLCSADLEGIAIGGPTKSRDARRCTHVMVCESVDDLNLINLSSLSKAAVKRVEERTQL